MTERRLLLTASPHLAGPDSVPKVMWSVAASLVPVVLVALYYFGPSAILVVVASTLGAVLTEGAFAGRATLGDGSAALTGLLLGLTLPPGFPMWMAFLGGAFGIALGKRLFGGIGFNVFNPALLGRAFLQGAFPVAITTWPKLGGAWWNLRGDNLAFPFASPRVTDAITAATPLGLMKFEHTGTGLWSLMIGNTGGSLGETCGLLLIATCGWLAWKNYLNWRIPVSICGSVAAFAVVLHAVSPARYPSAPFMLFSGGLLLGAVYMATDPVTSPVTHRGCWLFGLGVGVLVVLIRIWGGLPEGVMYSILIMNAFVPCINRATQPHVFGARKTRKAAAKTAKQAAA